MNSPRRKRAGRLSVIQKPRAHRRESDFLLENRLGSLASTRDTGVLCYVIVLLTTLPGLTHRLHASSMPLMDANMPWLRVLTVFQLVLSSTTPRRPQQTFESHAYQCYDLKCN